MKSIVLIRSLSVMIVCAMMLLSCGKPKRTPKEEAFAKEIEEEMRKRKIREAAEEKAEKDKSRALKAEFRRGMDQWLDAKFDSAFAYMYQGRFMSDSIAVSGKLHPTVLRSTKRRLTNEHVEELRTLLTSGEPQDYYFISQSDCFYPSQGFVFYERGKIRAHLSICYMCNGHIAKPIGQRLELEDIAHIFEELGLPLIRDEGVAEAYFGKVKK